MVVHSFLRVGVRMVAVDGDRARTHGVRVIVGVPVKERGDDMFGSSL